MFCRCERKGTFIFTFTFYKDERMSRVSLFLSSQFGDNTPTKKKKKKGKISTDWSVLQRLTDPALMGIDGEAKKFDTLLPRKRMYASGAGRS